MSSKTVSLTLQVSRADLPALMALAAKSGASINAAGGKAKKEKDPDAPKKDANDWILFTQRVRGVLLGGGCELKGIGIGQQFCSSVKEGLPTHTVTDGKGKEKVAPNYASISDAELLARFKKWAPPAHSKAEVERSSKASSEASSPAAPVAEKPKKKKAVEPAAAAWPSPPSQEENITEFAPIVIGGTKYMMNMRGDVLSENYERYIGRYNKVSKKLDENFKKPADLEDE